MFVCVLIAKGGLGTELDCLCVYLLLKGALEQS